jgi:hypothetical protein
MRRLFVLADSGQKDTKTYKYTLAGLNLTQMHPAKIIDSL